MQIIFFERFPPSGILSDICFSIRSGIWSGITSGGWPNIAVGILLKTRFGNPAGILLSILSEIYLRFSWCEICVFLVHSRPLLRLRLLMASSQFCHAQLSHTHTHTTFAPHTHTQLSHTNAHTQFHTHTHKQGYGACRNAALSAFLKVDNRHFFFPIHMRDAIIQFFCCVFTKLS